MEDEKQEKGFVIKDRRRFDESGDTRPETPREEAAAKPQEPKPEAKAAEPRSRRKGARSLDRDNRFPSSTSPPSSSRSARRPCTTSATSPTP